MCLQKTICSDIGERQRIFTANNLVVNLMEGVEERCSSWEILDPAIS